MIRSAGTQEPETISLINPVKKIYKVRWDIQLVNNLYSWQEETFTGKPELSDIKALIQGWYNEQVANKILSGWTWKGKQVWLSAENQQNYTAMAVAVKEGETLPTIKIGTSEAPEYYTFTSAEEVKEFFGEMQNFISLCLIECWRIKDAVDWNKYTI